MFTLQTIKRTSILSPKTCMWPLFHEVHDSALKNPLSFVIVMITPLVYCYQLTIKRAVQCWRKNDASKHPWLSVTSTGMTAITLQNCGPFIFGERIIFGFSASPRNTNPRTTCFKIQCGNSDIFHSVMNFIRFSELLPIIFVISINPFIFVKETLCTSIVFENS